MDVREQIAEAIRPMVSRVHEPLRSDIVHQWADHLVPLVERIATERAAQELEATAFNLDDLAGHSGGDVWFRAVLDFSDGLRHRAATLRQVTP